MMVWIPLILGSAVLLGLYDVAKKHAVNRNGVMPVLWLGVVVGLITTVVVLLVTGQLADAVRISGLTYWRLLLKAAIVSASWITGYYAMRRLPISIVTPIRGSQPIWTVAGALLLFGERPGWLQGLGLLVVILGYARLSGLGRAEGIHFRRDRGIALILAATLFGAVSSLYDKYLLQPCGIPPGTVQLWFGINLTLILGVTLVLQRAGGLARTPFVWRWSIVAVGVLLVAADWLYFMALSEPDALISLLSPVRRSSCVVSFLLGGLWFREVNRRRKAVALAVILAGVTLILLGSV